jgi:predicted TIM-barrel fold metal-dependent hydrolase
VAYSFKNVWVSPDLYMLGVNTPGADDYIKAANMYLSDRTLFGTAYPTRPLVESVQAFDQWSFSPGVRERILHKNAEILMRLPADA